MSKKRRADEAKKRAAAGNNGNRKGRNKKCKEKSSSRYEVMPCFCGLCNGRCWFPGVGWILDASKSRSGQEFQGQQELEELRLEEWKIDIPTIGFAYRAAEFVITYFNGLGRPFKPLGAFRWQDDERHWLNRLWTFQETKRPEDIIVGGLLDGMAKALVRPVSSNCKGRIPDGFSLIST